MSLKVLLADESPTIKKAFEIALKDFGVKVQSVHHGIDVKELCESFQPHICFLDVLLPKLNGYDASAQIKAEPHLARIPTVIMWSGFMEVDENKFMTSGASDRLEKPFETATLRQLVQKYVPSLNSNELSKYVIPDSISFDDDDLAAVSSTPQASTAPTAPPPVTDDVEDFSVESLGQDSNQGAAAVSQESSDFKGLDELDDFSIESLDTGSSDPNKKQSADADDIFGDMATGISSKEEDDIFGDAVQATPSREETDIFGSLSKIQSAPDADAIDEVFSIADTATPDEEKLPSLSTEELEPLKEDIPAAPPVVPPPVNAQPNQTPPPPSAAVTTPPPPSPVPPAAASNESKKEENFELLTSENAPQLSKDELKRLILAQSKDIIESVVWDVVPELARELIQKEISKLMGKIDDNKLDGDLR